MRKTLLLLSLIFCLSSALFAQEEEDHVPFLYLNLNAGAGMPVQNFGDRVDRPGFGGGAYFIFQLARLPIFAGVDVAYQILDNERLEIGPDLDLRTRNNLLMGHLLLRYQPAVRFPVWPYVEFKVGTKHLYTRTKLIEDLGEGEKDVLEADTDLSDWATSYGGAFGLQVPLQRNQGLLLDLRFGYLLGANAEYYARIPDTSNLTIEDSLDYFEKRGSPTNMITFQLGLTMELVTLAREE